MTQGDSYSIHVRLHRKTRLTASLVFETAWRIGSGQEGETMSDLGAMLDVNGQPILPGSSLKGKLRSTCEALAHALELSACMLNSKASGKPCASDIQFFSEARKPQGSYWKALRQSLDSRLQWIDENTCDVCKLFGSPVRASRLRISDGALSEWASVVQVRDGVVIDRDSQTAVDRLKYDYEVIPVGSQFEIQIDLENPTDSDLALLGAAVFEWHAGSSIGGFTSRGLGRFRLDNIRLSDIDLNDPGQRVKFLIAVDAQDRFTVHNDWKGFFSQRIHEQLQAPVQPKEN